MEAHALHRRGWKISAIARHLGRSRSTIRGYLKGEREPGVRRRTAPDPFTRFEEYVGARLREDPHVWATALFDEVRRLGYERSYQRFTHEIRARSLRPHCEPCSATRGRATIEIAHEPGDEIQWDWLELPGRSGTQHLLVGTLSYSGKTRAVFCESEDFGHLAAAIDTVLRKLGGTARHWRFDRMATVVTVGTGKLNRTFRAFAKYYGVVADVCPPRRGNRKGCVEKKNDFIAQRWFRTAELTNPEADQRSLDHFCETIADDLPRHGVTAREAADREGLLALPFAPYPATVEVPRRVGASALVSFEGNMYSVPPGLVGADVSVRTLLGQGTVDIVAATGAVLASHRRQVAGAGITVRSDEHHAALQEAVLGAFSTAPPCHRKENRPPGPVARAAADALRTSGEYRDVTVDLADWALVAEVAR